MPSTTRSTSCAGCRSPTPTELLSYEHDRELAAGGRSVNRDRFPGLRDGWARLDGPAGTQMVDSAIEAMADFMRSGHNANHGGAVRRGHATDELVASTRASVRDAARRATRAASRSGRACTALTMRFAGDRRAATLVPGDEVVCTRLDHDANVRPWVIAAERAGATVRFADPEPDTLELPGVRRRGGADRAHTLGRRDRRVQRGRHGPRPAGDRRRRPRAPARASTSTPSTPRRTAGIDFEALGCDVLACSAYKWFGPHIGDARAAAPELLEELQPDKLRPSPDEIPDRWELGTLPFESLAGVRAAAEYMLSTRLRRRARARGGAAAGGARRPRRMTHVTLYGAAADRAPTLMFNVDGRTAAEVAARARRARDRGLARQLLRARARAAPRPRPARRRPRRLRALQRRGGRRAAHGRSCGPRPGSVRLPPRERRIK